MGDTTSKSLRRRTIVRKWCSEECLHAHEVRQALRREASRRKEKAPSFMTLAPGQDIRFLPAPSGGPPTYAIYNHHYQPPKPGPAPCCTLEQSRQFEADDPVRTAIQGLDFGPIERHLLETAARRK
jgi:hypothetical protein